MPPVVGVSSVGPRLEATVTHWKVHTPAGKLAAHGAESARRTEWSQAGAGGEPAAAHPADRAVDVEHLEHQLQPGAPQVDDRLQRAQVEAREEKASRRKQFQQMQRQMKKFGAAAK